MQPANDLAGQGVRQSVNQLIGVPPTLPIRGLESPFQKLPVALSQQGDGADRGGGGLAGGGLSRQQAVRRKANRHQQKKAG